MLCTQVHRGFTVAYHECGASHKAGKLGQGCQSHPQFAVADLSQYAPDQDLGNLLGDTSRHGLPPPGQGNPILPSRFLLPSGERVDTRPSRGAKGSEVSPIADTAQCERGEYHGSASVHGLVESALEFRNGAKCSPMTFEERFPNRRREFWEAQHVSSLLVFSIPDGTLTSGSGWIPNRVPPLVV